VTDIIEELCNVIGVDSANEREEFSLYCIVEGETFTVPLAKDHYILDVTTGTTKFHLEVYLRNRTDCVVRHNFHR
jgi:myosin-15